MSEPIITPVARRHEQPDKPLSRADIPAAALYVVGVLAWGT